MGKKNMKKNICSICNELLSEIDNELNYKYRSYPKILICTSCLKKKEDKLSKKISKILSSDLDIYDY